MSKSRFPFNSFSFILCISAHSVPKTSGSISRCSRFTGQWMTAVCFGEGLRFFFFVFFSPFFTDGLGIALTYPSFNPDSVPFPKMLVLMTLNLACLIRPVNYIIRAGTEFHLLPGAVLVQWHPVERDWKTVHEHITVQVYRSGSPATMTDFYA